MAFDITPYISFQADSRQTPAEVRALCRDGVIDFPTRRNVPWLRTGKP